MSVGNIKGPPGGTPPRISTETEVRGVQQTQSTTPAKPAAPTDEMTGSAPRALTPSIEPIVVPPASAQELEEHLATFSALSALVGPKPQDVETAGFLALGMPELERASGGVAVVPAGLVPEQQLLTVGAQISEAQVSQLSPEARAAALSAAETVRASLRGEAPSDAATRFAAALEPQIQKGADPRALVEAAMFEGARGVPVSLEQLAKVYRTLAQSVGVPQ